MQRRHYALLFLDLFPGHRAVHRVFVSYFTMSGQASIMKSRDAILAETIYDNYSLLYDSLHFFFERVF
jgi:hypothetical protein